MESQKCCEISRTPRYAAQRIEPATDRTYHSHLVEILSHSHLRPQLHNLIPLGRRKRVDGPLVHSKDLLK